MDEGVMLDRKKKGKPAESTRLCVHCGKIYSRPKLLNAHVKTCKYNAQITNEKSQFVCTICGKSFAFHSGIHRHERYCKTGNFPMYRCRTCSSVFSRSDNYKVHVRVCATRSKAPRFRCSFDGCSAVFFQKTKLLQHLRAAHKVALEDEQTYAFADFNEFQLWKKQEETRTNSCFTKNCGTKGGNVYYNCQFAGKKSLCTRLCLAKMRVKVSEDGSVNVAYQPAHTHNEFAVRNELDVTAGNCRNEIAAPNLQDGQIQRIQSKIAHLTGLINQGKLAHEYVRHVETQLNELIFELRPNSSDASELD